jgi:hypothetical protein
MSQSIVPIFLGILLVSCPFSSLGSEGASSSSTGATGPTEAGLNGEATALQAGDDAASQMLPLCLGFTDERWLTICGAVFNKDISACEALAGEGLAERCGAYVASVSKDPSVCEDVNPFIRGEDANGKIAQTTIPSDCYDYAASFMADTSLCAKADSPTGCEYRVKIWTDEWAYTECAESECVFAYAWKHNSTNACDRFDKMIPSDSLASRIRCDAMLSGYKMTCNEIISGDADVIYNCQSLSLYRQAMPVPGRFYPEKCDGYTDCERDVLEYMVRWASTR